MTTGIETMPEAALLLGSPEAFGSRFQEGLRAILDDGREPGTFILVLANALSEPGLLQRLRAPLEARFEAWCRWLDADGPAVAAAPADDVAVLRRLRESGGPALLGPVQRRLAGPWEVQFNPLRAMRPARMSASALAEEVPPFDPSGFHFDQPYLRGEVFWEGAWNGNALRLLYNKFPFAERHALLVPDPGGGRPQRLDPGTHALAWSLCERFGAALPGLGLGYNAYGAHASVNHLHLQMFARSSGAYPVEAPRWRHNGGAEPYPLPVARHEEADSAWAAIEALHARGGVYNLLYRPGVLYLVPRLRQGSVPVSPWHAGLAWAELAGSLALSDAGTYAGLEPGAIVEELGRVAAPG
jgi:diadenosine tetraphosphate (Ap4A) HIT family hydrolase